MAISCLTTDLATSACCTTILTGGLQYVTVLTALLALGGTLPSGTPIGLGCAALDSLPLNGVWYVYRFHTPSLRSQSEDVISECSVPADWAKYIAAGAPSSVSELASPSDYTADAASDPWLYASR